MFHLKSTFLIIPVSVVAVAVAVLLSTAPALAQTPQLNQAPAMNGAAAPATGAAAGTTTAAKPTEKTFSDDMNSFAGIMDPFDYEQRGRRDPFVEPIPDRPVQAGSLRGPLLPLQKFDLAQLALVGIIWDVKHPKAMIKDPTGQTHVVGTNTKVGPRNGYIAVIREGEMVVVETTEQEGKLVSSAQVVKIAR